MDVTNVFAQVVTSGGFATLLTQILKVAEGVHPYLAKIPFIGPSIAWLVDTITPEDPGAIRIFNASVSYLVVLFMGFLQTGHAEMNLVTALTGLASFLQSQGLFILLLKGKKVSLGNGQAE